MKKIRNKNILCACGGYCEGECRKLHLYRKRDYADRCTAAYDKEKK